MSRPIYLDYLATTPVDTQVAQKMGQCLTMDGNFGNPASRSHIVGWQAEAAVEEARREVADLIAADPREIVWTSGATESDNLAIKGVAHFHQVPGQAQKKRHIITSAIEHKAVLDTCTHLEQEGFEITYLAPDADGIIQAEKVAASLRQDTVLVSIMHVNNELGTINDIAAIAEHTRAAGVLLHVDAAQSVGKVAVDMRAWPVDLLSLSAHKFYGPKGIGALYVRRNPPVSLQAQIHGGGHERGMRSGTLPTHQIVGMGEAARIARETMVEEAARLLALRQRFWQGVSMLPDVRLNGSPMQRVPGALNIAFGGIDGETLLMALQGLAISSGSACTSASLAPSHVLQAIGLDDELAHASLRFSFGRFTSEADIDQAVAEVTDTLIRLKGGAL
ncbi:MAG: IscS subfamily cysteine desulfurase [Parahaliea sp.]